MEVYLYAYLTHGYMYWSEYQMRGRLLGLSPCVLSYKRFSPQNRGLSRYRECAEHLFTQLAALALFIHIFLPPPVLFIDCTPNPLFLERESTLVPCFVSTKVPLLSSCSAHSPCQLEQGLIIFFYNYGSWYMYWIE